MSPKFGEDLTMAVTSTFDPATGTLTTTGDDLANAITHSRNAAGAIWSTAARCR